MDIKKLCKEEGIDYDCLPKEMKKSIKDYKESLILSMRKYLQPTKRIEDIRKKFQDYLRKYS